MFMKQTSTLALLSTSDRAITLPAKRWTPPVIGQLILRRDVCLLLDTMVNTTAPSAHSYCSIHNHCLVQLCISAFHFPELLRKNELLGLIMWTFAS